MTFSGIQYHSQMLKHNIDQNGREPACFNCGDDCPFETCVEETQFVLKVEQNSFLADTDMPLRDTQRDR